MQAAIDRVLRTFSLTPFAPFAEDRRPDMREDEAVAVATRLLENYKSHLGRSERLKD